METPPGRTRIDNGNMDRSQKSRIFHEGPKPYTVNLENYQLNQMHYPEEQITSKVMQMIITLELLLNQNK